MSEEEKEAIEILQGLCTDDCVNNDIVKTIVKLIEKQQKEIEELKFKYQTRKDRTKAIIEGLQEELEEKENKYDDFTTAYLQGVYDGKKNLKYKIKAILEEYKYTEIGDSEKIIEFYKKMQSLLEKE